MGVMGEQAPNPFDRDPSWAAGYDDWYESGGGRAVFEAERRCLSALLEPAPRPLVELGTGSGRFGGALGAEVGLDPAPALLALARARLPAVLQGAAEALPFKTGSVGSILAVTVFEFLPAPARALQEIALVLRPGGYLVLGFIPGASAWADAYRQDGRNPDSVFAHARFFSPADVTAAAGAVGLRRTGACAALFEPPGGVPSVEVSPGADPSAGFVALQFVKPAP